MQVGEKTALDAPRGMTESKLFDQAKSSQI